MRVRQRETDVGERIMSMLASLFFSVPTSVLLWLSVNIELVGWGQFLHSGYLWGTIGFFATTAFFFPALFPSVIGAVWQLMIRFWRIFG